MAQANLEIMDTTLRDGEQTSGVSYTPTEKLSIAKILLKDLKVDRIEVASARVSQGEFEGVKKITKWAKENGYLDAIEVLGFVDTPISLDWIHEAGARVINLLTKGSLNHLVHQLKRTPEEHIEGIYKSVEYAQSKGIKTNVYLEDWSNGMRNSKDYVFQMIDALSQMPIERIMLPDTLGILFYDEAGQFVKECVDKYPSVHFDFHAHNDYDVSVANTLEAIRSGAKGVHTTINGLGERAGNAPMASIVACVKDHLKLTINIEEEQLNRASKIVESYSGIRIPSNKPVVGEHVFTQTAGIHADGDSKNNLYFNDLLPERFGRKRKYALGKSSGKANIRKNLEELGLKLEDEELKLVTEHIIQLGDKKETVSTDDLPYIISEVIRKESLNENIKLKDYNISTGMNLKPKAKIILEINGKEFEAEATGEGQYDAFMTALRKIAEQSNLKVPNLLDYNLRIPPGGKTDAFVEAQISWDYKGKEFKTVGFNSDQIWASMQATLRALNRLQ